MPAKGNRFRFTLQCGHGRLTVENFASRLPERGHLVASMRPRSVDRGELQLLFDIQSAFVRLQCGHGRLTVENCPTGGHPA